MASHPRLRQSGSRLKNARFTLSRKILAGWIRPTFLDNTRRDLTINDADLVCYVLPFRSTADLLVADMACEFGGLPSPVDPVSEIDEGRAVFFLSRPEGTLGRKSQRRQSERMTRLFEHQTFLPEGRTIKIVPVSIFWGHQPDREKSLFKILLSEHWSATSSMKKLLAGLFHPRHILVQFGTPIPLDELMASEEERPRQIRKLLRLLRVHFNSQRRAIIGPDLSHRRTLINTLLDSKGVRNAIDREARSGGATYAAVEKKAAGYAQEIASHQSYRVIRFFDVLLTWLWNNLYGGIEVNNIEVVKKHAQSFEIVYIPCHRSHIDYLLLSYVLYHNGLTPPHIAAGKNLNLPLFGPLLRRGGAFFMRRSFQGDALYREVFDEYLHQMFTKGYSVEYFIEGSRSRTGRTLPPRTGMLRMTVRSFQKDSTKPIAFMPVYFGYERVLESSTYMAELSGKDKKSESVFDVFGIFSSFKREFGRVTVNFGEPVLLHDFLDQRLEFWDQPLRVTSASFTDACQTLAELLATRINSAVAVKPTNLVAVALLSTTRQNIEEQYLLAQIQRLREIAINCGPDNCSVTNESPEDILNTAVQVIGLTRRSHRFGTIVSASPEQSVNLTYNANNVNHVFALPSLVARFVRAENQTTPADINAFISGIYPYISSEMFLPWPRQALEEVVSRVIKTLAGSGIINQFSSGLTVPGPGSPEYNALSDMARISDAILERFFIVITLLRASTRVSLKELETISAGVAEQMSVLYGINSPDFFDKSLFSNFLTSLKRQKTIGSELEVAEGFDAVEAIIARSLDADVRYNILQTVAHYVAARSGPEESGEYTS